MSNKKILIVDDDEDIHDLLRFNLKKIGCESVSAYSIQEAIKIISNPDIGLVILDLQFSEQAYNGTTFLSVTHQMSQNGSRIPPIVVMSSQDDQEIVDFVIDIGARAFLPKPYKPTVLADFVSSYYA